jgi:hypothetical protein
VTNREHGLLMDLHPVNVRGPKRLVIGDAGTNAGDIANQRSTITGES